MERPPMLCLEVSRLDDALLLTTSVTACRARSDAWDNLAARTRLQRTWGDCYGYVLVATGRADVMLDPAMNPWDSAALLPILREAGGHFSDWQARRPSGPATRWRQTPFSPRPSSPRCERKRSGPESSRARVRKEKPGRVAKRLFSKAARARTRRTVARERARME
jgi:hypothetical protein